jgi:hypothetical protein
MACQLRRWSTLKVAVPYRIAIIILLTLCQVGGSCYTPAPCVQPDENAPKYLLVYANGGVSNRLKALAASYAMAKLTNRKLIVDWRIEPGEVPARFEDLFKNPIERPETMVLPENWKVADLYDTRSQCPEVVTRLYYDVSSYREFTRIPNITSQIVMVDSRYVYGVAPEFAPFTEHLSNVVQFLKDLEPVDAVKKEVDSFVQSQFPSLSAVVGVHYRSWGLTFDSGLPKSNPETFVAKMQEIVKADPNVKFFIASDSLETLAFFRSQMPGRVLTYTLSTIDRESVESQRNSLIEWYLLGQTDYLIGTFDSSFSETAALLTKQKRDIAIGPQVWDNYWGDMYCFDANGTALARDADCLVDCCKNYYP